MKSEKIIVNVASYKRMKSLIATLESIIDQCDIVNVILNDTEEDIPLILFNEKINLFISDNSLGDAAKFLKLMDSEGYFFTIDDDLIYPPTYISDTIKKCKEFNDKKVVTYHGRNFSSFPISSYYNSASEKYHVLHEVDKDMKVQFGGTGVMCFHTSLLKIPLSYFQYSNMADVWFGKYCMENNIEIICLSHKKNYINYIFQKTTIYDQQSNQDNLQTLIVNSIYDKTINFELNKNLLEQKKQNESEYKDVSIIIPTYGTPQYLKECIESIYRVIKKKYKIEILIGIDNCTETINFLKNFNIDNKTKIFFFEKNLGPYVVKNTLAKIANSEYIIFFDSDDIMIDGMIENVLNYLKIYNIIKPKCKNFSGVLDVKSINTKNSNIWGEGVFGIRKDDFLKLNGFENWRCAADSDFMIRAERCGLKIKRSDDLMFFRRLHKKGITSAKDTGHNSKLRNYYIKLIKNKKNFGPLDNLVTSEVKLIKIDYNNINFCNFDQNDDKIKIEKNNELLKQISEKKGKINIVSKIILSQKTEPINKINNRIEYEVINNVTQHRMNQKLRYSNAVMKTNFVTKKFNK